MVVIVVVKAVEDRDEEEGKKIGRRDRKDRNGLEEKRIEKVESLMMMPTTNP